MCFFADTLAFLCILLLHLTDGLLLPSLQRRKIYLGDTWHSAIEARRRLGYAFARCDNLERQDVCEGDDVVVTGLAGEGRRGVWRGRGSVDGNGIGEVACGEEGALEDIVIWCAGDFDSGEEFSLFQGYGYGMAFSGPAQHVLTLILQPCTGWSRHQ